MKLSVIVPVFNEENTIKEVLAKLKTIKSVSQIIVVNDGSTDSTLKKIKKFISLQKKTTPKFQLIDKQNGGKGSAIRVGLKQVTGDYVLIQDADLEYDPEDIPALIEPIVKDKATVVYGSRFLGPHNNLLFWHRVGNTILNFLVNLLYNTTLSDMETCYKVLPTSLMKKINIKADRFDLEPEITCKVLKNRIRIFEVPISYVGRDFSEGKKITWKDGFAALATIFKIKLFYSPKSKL